MIGSELIAQPFASDKYFFSSPLGGRLQGRRDRRVEPRHQEPRPSQEDRRAGRGAEGDRGRPGAGRPGDGLGRRASTRTSPPKRPTTRRPASPPPATAGRPGPNPDRAPHRALRRDHRRTAAGQRPEAQPRPRRGEARLRPARRAEPAKAAEAPAPSPTASASPVPAAPARSSPPGPGVAEEVGAIESRVGEIAGQIEKLGKQIESIARARSLTTSSPGLKAIEAKLTGLSRRNPKDSPTHRSIGRTLRTGEGNGRDARAAPDSAPRDPEGHSAARLQ